MQVGALKHDVGNDAEDGQRDALLDDLELDEIERSAVFDEAQSVGWYLTAVFKEGDTPGEYDNGEEWPVARCA